MAVHLVGLLVQREARSQRGQAGLVVPAYLGVVAARQQRLGGQQAGLVGLADALAGERVGAAGRLAGDQHAGPRRARARQRTAQRGR